MSNQVKKFVRGDKVFINYDEGEPEFSYKGPGVFIRYEGDELISLPEGEEGVGLFPLECVTLVENDCPVTPGIQPSKRHTIKSAFLDMAEDEGLQGAIDALQNVFIQSCNGRGKMAYDSDSDAAVFRILIAYANDEIDEDHGLYLCRMLAEGRLDPVDVLAMDVREWEGKISP